MNIQMQIEIVGNQAIAAAEDLCISTGLRGDYNTPSTTERDGTLVVVASIVGIVSGSLFIAEQIHKWFQNWSKSTSKSEERRRIEKVLIAGKDGQRLLLKNATVEDIKKLIEASSRENTSR